jgi:peptidoglycan/LPS O-acetylase OafA/YrhL
MSTENNLIRRHMPELDVVRGVAALAVFYYHGFTASYGWSGLHGWYLALALGSAPGWLGVNLFFVLSGFLITGILLDSDHKFYFRRFYRRRACRILPVYLLLMAVMVVGRVTSVRFTALSCLFLSNMTPLLGVAFEYTPLWSLAVEEHFYLVWPQLVRRLSRVGLATVALGIALTVPLLRASSFMGGNYFKDVHYRVTWLTCDGLAIGALLALAVRSARRRADFKRLIIISGSFAVSGLLVLAIIGRLNQRNALGVAFEQSFLNVLFGCLVASALLVGSSRFAALARNRVLEFFGYISYGFYLLHVFAFQLYDSFIESHIRSLVASNAKFGLVLLRFTIVLTFCTAVSWISRETYEEKFLQFKNPVRKRTIAAAAPESTTSAV